MRKSVEKLLFYKDFQLVILTNGAAEIVSIQLFLIGTEFNCLIDAIKCIGVNKQFVLGS